VNRSQRRLHVAVWAALVAVLAITVAAALVVDLQIERAAKMAPAAMVR
jgi:hypothetical protein